MRPILIATIGYIIGILWELYFKSIALFLFIVAVILFVIIYKKRNLKITRYLKVLIPLKQIAILISFALFATCYIKIINYRYENSYKEFQENESTFVATVITEKKEYEYRDAYTVKVEYAYNKDIKKKISTNLLLKVEKEKNNNLEIGDKIIIKGEFKRANDRTNFKGYSYNEYLKSKAIYGEIESGYSNIKVIKKNNINIISIIANKFREKIIKNMKQILPKETCNLTLGILIGYTEEMSEKIKESFKDASLSHMLAVSGSHISYIIVGVSFLIEKIKCEKRTSKILTIIVLLFFMFLTGFTPSVIRACIMGITMMISEIIYKENDFICSICFSALIILIINPFTIYNAGFKLSFGGAIGIVVFQKNIKTIISGRKKKVKRYNEIMVLEKKCTIVLKKIKNFLIESLTVTIAAQIAIIPIIALDFNTVSLTFFISNLLASFFMGIITIGGFMLAFLSFISIEIAKVIGKIYNIPLVILIKIVELCAKIPGSKIYIITIYTITAIIYYIAILMWNYIYDISSRMNIGVAKLIKKIIKKNAIKQKKKTIKKIAIIGLIVLIGMYPIKNKFNQTKIYFVDVGQGDCTVIITQCNKKIIIDGGGNNIENSLYDVGESVLFPYLLDRKINSLDYVIISHFDSDHYKGLEYVIKNMQVKTVIIPKQFEESDNYADFIEIAKDRKIKVIEVKAGQRIMLDKEVEMSVLWPIEDYIKENAINNNSIVFKIYFEKFSALFTGDIEEEAEKQIVSKYKNVEYNGENVLRSDILKVAHHGSKSSSIQEFIELVKPEIALIGVGKNNNFGHPNGDVINRLEGLRYKNI